MTAYPLQTFQAYPWWTLWLSTTPGNSCPQCSAKKSGGSGSAFSAIHHLYTTCAVPAATAAAGFNEVAACCRCKKARWSIQKGIPTLFIINSDRIIMLFCHKCFHKANWTKLHKCRSLTLDRSLLSSCKLYWMGFDVISRRHYVF